MISKILKSRSNFHTTVLYATQSSKDHEVMLSNGVRDYDPQKTIADFYRQAAMNSNIKKVTFHMVISHHPDDTHKIKDKEKEILKTYIDKLKAKDFDLFQTQFIIYKHKNTPACHYHLVASYISHDGSRLSDSNIGIKAKIASKELTKEFNLTPAIKKGKQDKESQLQKTIIQNEGESKGKSTAPAGIEPNRSDDGYSR
jgi:hypothetical protein